MLFHLSMYLLESTFPCLVIRGKGTDKGITFSVNKNQNKIEISTVNI